MPEEKKPKREKVDPLSQRRPQPKEQPKPIDLSADAGYAGRGTRSTQYRPEFPDYLIEHMKAGGSVDTFSAFLRKKTNDETIVHRATCHEWLKKHKEFAEAKKHGDDLSLAFWEDAGKAGMMGQLKFVKSEEFDPNTGQVIRREYGTASFNSGAWIFLMKNKHKWTDKFEQSHTLNDGKDTREDKQAAFERLMATPGAPKALEALSGIIDTTATKS